MSRFMIAGAVALLGLGSMAQASAQTAQCRNNQLAGAVVGGLAGGVVGGAIADDRRGFRRGRHGFRRGYGRGYRRGFRRGSNRGAGIVIGALAGGLIGSQLAKTSQNCTQQPQGYATPPQRFGHQTSGFGGYPNQGYQGPAPQGPVLSGGPVPEPATQSVPTECRLTDRFVDFPDGTRTIETVEVCRTLPNGAWIVSGDGF